MKPDRNENTQEKIKSDRNNKQLTIKYHAFYNFLKRHWPFKNKLIAL